MKIVKNILKSDLLKDFFFFTQAGFGIMKDLWFISVPIFFVAFEFLEDNLFSFLATYLFWVLGLVLVDILVSKFWKLG